MKQKILGLDLGTNSIGISVRNTQVVGPIDKQLEYFSSIVFPSGVGRDQHGEFSFAAQRTKFRGSRRLHQSRRYRIWRTLEVLILNGFCPLSMDGLDKWRTYDRSTGRKRQYPNDDYEFEQWVRLDFDCDGLPEYSSPFELRAELMDRQFDFNNITDRYKLGRALYHIAQHRGFKSSKGEVLKDNADKGNEVDMSSALKQSEEKLSKGLVEYMVANACPTAGCAFYDMQKKGIRVRDNKDLQAVRSQLEQEIRAIFEYQDQLDCDSDFYNQIISRKKGEGSIFYKRPLRSQKGLVGKCTFEKNKSRCPISRPEFEQFRAWSIINNLRYKTSDDTGKAVRELPLEYRVRLYNEHFVRVSNFKMSDVLKWLQKMDSSIGELNYDGKTTVQGSPVCAKLRDLLGTDWEHAELCGYNYEELWHVCFESDKDDESFIIDFAQTHLNADDALINKMVGLWEKIGTDYASLSLKAICNILRMLREGYIYSTAVLLAKLPDIFGANWEVIKDALLRELPSITQSVEEDRLVNKIANKLIERYKILPPEEQFAFHNTDYTLDDRDLKDIKKCIIDTISKKTWMQLHQSEQDELFGKVRDAYQLFFRSANRNYIRNMHLDNALVDLIEANFMDYVVPTYVNKILEHKDVLYHPSIVAIYDSSNWTTIVEDNSMRSIKLLNSPATNVFRNPVVMRVLHQLRSSINALIKRGIIDESNTSIVIETAREMNDANWRKAIQTYQKDREKENDKYRKQLLEYLPENKITDRDIEKVRLWDEQTIADLAEQKKLWYEQNKQCLYTGKMIKLTDLLEGRVEIEHTIPRSISFDDSLANKTLCSAAYNRIKNNRFPSELPDADYQALLSRIQPWFDKIESIKKQIITQRNNSKTAATKDAKDKAITKKHVLEMELAYWRDKVSRFTIKKEEWKDSFRNNQLNDTRTITKYAYHFLKTVFDEVSVQRGDMTANFRKALGVQSLEEKKNRDLHSHHAIDATMLTLIPTNAKRDKLLELFFRKEELARLVLNDKSLIEALKETERDYDKLLQSCDIDGVDKIVDFIENNIIVHHQSKDQALTPASRRVRVRGKVVRDNNKDRWMKGDSLRGSLHKETWYGAIAMPKQDADGMNILDANGNIIPDTNNIKYVVRRSLSAGAFKNWADLEKVIVDKALFQMLYEQYPGCDFQTACEKGLYMLDSEGNRINRIRHIRCFTKVKNPVVVKAQTYSSKHSHKQNYLAEAGDLTYVVKYQSEDGEIIQYEPYSLYTISQNRKYANIDIPHSIQSRKGKKLHMVCALRSGINVLLYKEHVEELRGMPNKDLSKRLYVIEGFESDGRIKLSHHLSAKDCDGETIKDWMQLPTKVRCGVRTLNFLVEGVDFVITTNGIEFK